MAQNAQRGTSGCLIALLVAAVVVGAAVLGGVLLLLGDIAVPPIGPAVAVVDVHGVIGEDDRVLEQLDEIEKVAKPRALVLDIDSPGGGAAETQRIVRRLQEYQNDGVPIVAALESVAASGGYYVASSADTIVSLPASLVGSIGVIMAFPEFSALLTKLGIDYQVVTAGRFKDVGSFYRPLTKDERRWLEQMAEQILDQFVAAVHRGRPEMTLEQVRDVADGRIFTGETAHDLGLVDEMGTLEDAIAIAGRMAGLGPKPRLIHRPARQSWLDRLLEERLGGIDRVAAGAPPAWPRVEYRWR